MLVNACSKRPRALPRHCRPALMASRQPSEPSPVTAERGAGFACLAWSCWWMSGLVTVGELIYGHVSLDVECMDRISSTGECQLAGGRASGWVHGPSLGLPDPFAGDHGKDRDLFRRAAHAFAAGNHVPLG